MCLCCFVACMASVLLSPEIASAWHNGTHHFSEILNNPFFFITRALIHHLKGIYNEPTRPELCEERDTPKKVYKR